LAVSPFNFAVRKQQECRMHTHRRCDAVRAGSSEQYCCCAWDQGSVLPVFFLIWWQWCYHVFWSSREKEIPQRPEYFAFQKRPVAHAAWPKQGRVPALWLPHQRALRACDCPSRILIGSAHQGQGGEVRLWLGLPASRALLLNFCPHR
jgi:hypothetical protein